MALEQRSKIVALQTDLTNSEEVQRDFVRLSQSLQQELERIRESGTLVTNKLIFCSSSSYSKFVANVLIRCDGNTMKISLIVEIVELYFLILKFEK